MNSLLSPLFSIFNRTPGPFLAKITLFWKLSHLLRGTYKLAISALHERCGPVVQVSPDEYSIANDITLTGCPGLKLASKNFDKTAFQLLKSKLIMKNVMSKENEIEDCNTRLLARFKDHVATGVACNVSDLIHCYAYELMIRITTGQKAGLLDKEIDVQKAASVLNDWKFHSILFGSYLRFHPWIALVLRHFKRGDYALRQPIKIPTTDGITCVDIGELSIESQDGPSTEHADGVEVRVALSLAAADPVIILATTVFRKIYGSADLLSKVRTEMVQADIWSPPKIRQIMIRMNKMPLLQAALDEVFRLHQTQYLSKTFTVPDGGISIEGKMVPQGSTIALQSTLFPRDKHVQTAIVVKLLMQIIPVIDMSEFSESFDAVVTSKFTEPPTSATHINGPSVTSHAAPGRRNEVAGRPNPASARTAGGRNRAPPRPARAQRSIPNIHSPSRNGTTSAGQVRIDPTVAEVDVAKPTLDGWSSFAVEEHKRMLHFNTNEGREGLIKEMQAQQLAAPKVETQYTSIYLRPKRFTEEPVQEAPKPRNPNFLPPHLRARAAPSAAAPSSNEDGRSKTDVVVAEKS